MNKYTAKDKLQYYFDKQMAKGTSSIIRLLANIVLSIALFVAIMMLLTKLKDSFFPAFWDSLANIVNSWMPTSEDGSVGELVLNSITALVGLLFSSMLIGIISSALEEKIQNLRQGNSVVLEKNHTVILGYNLGEHGLLKQLLQEQTRQKRCIVIFTDNEKTALEDDLERNIRIPKGVEIICRHGDITSLNDLQVCSIENARVIIINALNDTIRLKALLAVSAIKNTHPECKAKIIACVSDDAHLLPDNKLQQHEITMLQTNQVIAKLIANVATEPGLSNVMREIMDYEGNEIYFERIPAFVNKTFYYASCQLNNAVLLGLKNKTEVLLDPAPDTIISVTDELIVFEESQGSYRLSTFEDFEPVLSVPPMEKEKIGHNLVIFGNSIILDSILDELSNEITNITIICKNRANLSNKFGLKTSIHSVFVDDITDKKLDKYIAEADHIIVLNNRDADKTNDDVDNILLILRIMNIIEQKGYKIHITSELNMENTYNLIAKNDETDYIISSSIASLLLAQLTRNVELRKVFTKLLSSGDRKLSSKPINIFNLKADETYTFQYLKKLLLAYNYVLLGYEQNANLYMNPSISQKITFTEKDRLVILGR